MEFRIAQKQTFSLPDNGDAVVEHFGAALACLGAH